MNFLVVYVGDASKINLEYGIRNHIWGFKSDVISNLKDFENRGNSYILLGTGYTGGSPRAQLKEWQKHRLQKIYIAKLKGNFYHDISVEWPDEEAMKVEKRYTERIRFEDVKILENISLDSLPEKIVNKFQSSGCSRSRGYIVDLQESEIPQLLLDKIQWNKKGEVVKEKSVISYQKIVYGAPGTGKSYSLEKDVEEYAKDKKSIKERVTFYDGYTYGQFVGAYKPIPCTVSLEEKNDITYKYIPGPISRLLKEAYSDSDTEVILIIEEINRARADRVFGNIFQLLDRDEQSRESEYPISLSEEQERYFRENLSEDIYRKTIERKGGLYLPKNFYILATMNSADQGVYPMDTAFKRRWTFSYIGLDENADKFGDSGVKYSIRIEGDKIDSNGEKIQGKRVEWELFRKTVNNILLEERVPEDRLIAPFFIKKNDFEISSDPQLNGIFILKQDIFQSKILMYLFDDVLRHRGKKTLFNEGINTFSTLLSELRSGNRIFSKEFYQEIENRENE